MMLMVKWVDIFRDLDLHLINRMLQESPAAEVELTYSFQLHNACYMFIASFVLLFFAYSCFLIHVSCPKENETTRFGDGDHLDHLNFLRESNHWQSFRL